MATYFYRDSRRQVLNDALAALADDQVDLRAALQAEIDALQTDDWTVTDDAYVAIGLDWLWSVRLTLKMQVDDDPAFTALGRAALLTDAQAAMIETIPHGASGPPADFLDMVWTAIDQDQAVFTELMHAGHRRWLQLAPTDRAYPFDDVDVMLPLRLETLFDAPGTTFNDDPVRWKLSLRVIPDEASIRRDNAFVSSGEANALVAFWAAVQQPGDITDTWLEGDDAAVAWRLLCDRVTGPRAAWLVANILFHLEGEQIVLDLPADMPTEAPPNRVGGLPPELRVFAAVGGGRQQIGRLPMDEAAVIDPANLDLPLPANLAEEKTRWWASWETAVAVGLGGEWLLDPGITPDTLEALFVVGIGDETPDAHFKTQVDAGEFAMLRLGTPTNAVRGKPAADLGQNADDWRTVAQMRLRQRLGPVQNPIQPAAQRLQRYMVGTLEGLPYFPGAGMPTDDTRESRNIMQALFPALWGHWLRDIWQSGDDMYRVASWAYSHLMPEGPLMPVRIADQPYGVLPVTALSEWVPDFAFMPEQQTQRQIEIGMARALTFLRQRWAAFVRGIRTVVGKTTEEFMALLAQDGVSAGYMFRYFEPAWALVAADPLDPQQRDEFLARAMESYRPASELFGREPSSAFLGANHVRFLRLPLVNPTRMTYRHVRHIRRQRVPLPEFLNLLFEFDPAVPLDEYDIEAIFNRWWVLQEYGDYQLSTLPDSLLIRLLIYASQMGHVWRREAGASELAHRILDRQQKTALELAEMLDDPAWRIDEQDPMNAQEPLFKLQIPNERKAQLERAFRATLDSASSRIDPWITGFAWQRLQKHADSPRSQYRLGAYGWVDGPFMGQPGPTDAGRLHTPSFSQTMSAIILRDKYLSSRRAGLRNDAGDNPWDIDISSSRVRLTIEIADEVRMGFHIYEVIGRLVEHIIGAHQTVKELRTHPTYAMYPDRRDPHEVCNGKEALAGLLAGDPAFPITVEQRQALQHIVDTLDTYGDLLMADGVLQLVNRQIDRAAESMDAASGFSRPPTFEFVRTPPSGYQLETMVVSALPFVGVETLDASALPARIADPSVASFLDSALAGDWTWQAVNADNNVIIGTAALVDFGLTPVDTLTLSHELLSDWVRHGLGLPLIYISDAENRAWTVRDAAGNPLSRITLVELGLTPDAMTALDTPTLHEQIRQAAMAPADAIIDDVLLDDPRLWIVRDENGVLRGLASPETLQLAPADDGLEREQLHRMIRLSIGVPKVRIDAPRHYLLAQELTAALGSRPAAGRDFTQDPAAQAANDTGIFAELRGRYEALHAACGQLVNDLRAAGEDGQRAVLLRRTLLWGITPSTEPADREALMAALTGVALPADATPLATLCEAVAKTLEDRLSAAPAPADLPTDASLGAPQADHEERKKKQIPDGVPSLARAIASLAAPNGKLAILASWLQTALINSTALVTAQSEPTLDEQWLTVVAAARAPLARLEALQLELAALEAWSSAPGDPWRTALVSANLAQREISVVGLTMPRFTAAYGTGAAWAGERVAVGLIDAFSEAIPMPQRSTSTAFGFNAPAARAPQAILLAVPPRPRQHLDAELLLRIVDEARELAHARTAQVEDLGGLQALAPSLWLQTSPPIRTSLAAYPIFE